MANDPTKDKGLAKKGKPSPWPILAVYLFFGILGFYLVFHQTINGGFRLLQSDPGDGRLCNYFLEHSYKFFFDKGYQASFWSPANFYPIQHILTFSENLLGSSFIYFLFRPFLPADTSFQLWMMAMVILNYLAFALMMRKLGANHFFSALGGFLFAFSAARVAFLGFHQLLPQFYTPLFIIFFWSFCKKPCFSNLIFALSMIYLQLLASFYLGWFLALSLLFFIPIFFIIRREDAKKVAVFIKKEILKVVPLLLSFFLMLGLFFYPYVKTMQLYGRRYYDEVFLMLPRIKSYLAAGGSTIWGHHLDFLSRGLPMRQEHRLFMGFAFILLTILALYFLFWQTRKKKDELLTLGRIFLLTSLTLFILSLKIPGTDSSLWKIVYDFVPGSGAIRGVARIALVTYFYLMVANIITLQYFFLRKSKAISLLIIVFISLMLAEQITFKTHTYDKIASRAEENRLVEAMKLLNCEVYYYSFSNKLAEIYMKPQLEMMWAGLETNRKVINGYTGPEDSHYGTPLEAMNLTGVKDWLNYNNQTASDLCFIVDKREPKETTSNLSSYPLVEETGSFSVYRIQ